ncbi:Mettl21c [Symbiodinium pilosum]|uniref:Mettl21c protein n=1 Tax=Symbiodinium pilosum TaxID=2952 RepID=A0A812S3W9_SYMPI|nr:Mettl21c [Symbiodinium pilosum]
MSGQLTNNPEHVPMADKETSVFQFAHKDTSVSVSQRRKSLETEDPLATDHTGDIVWPTAVAFCRYLCDKKLDLEGRRVLDLGAGTGLVGLVAHRLGAKSVTFTDVPRVLPLLNRNVTLHCIADATSKVARRKPAGEAIVRPLFWGREEAEELVQERGHFDLVMCCEVVYQQPQETWRTHSVCLPTSRRRRGNGCALLRDPGGGLRCAPGEPGIAE